MKRGRGSSGEGISFGTRYFGRRTGGEGRWRQTCLHDVREERGSVPEVAVKACGVVEG